GGARSGSSERPAVLESRDHGGGASIRIGPRRRWWRAAALGVGALAALSLGYALRGGSRTSPPATRAAMIAPTVSNARNAPADLWGWRALDIGAKEPLYGIWGSGPDDIYVVGNGMFHYDGIAWKSIHLPTIYRSDTVRSIDV